MENDLHPGNWGFDVDKNLIRMDFDRSLWPLSCKYLKQMPQEVTFFEKAILNKHLAIKPADAFVITAEDIINFPDLSDAKPTCWVTGNRYNVTFEYLSELKNNDDFIKLKWKYFLKSILITDEIVVEIFSGYIGSPKTSAKFSNHLKERIKKLEEVLLTIPQFCEYVKNNPKVIDELVAEFNEYNSNVKDKRKDLRINIDEVKKTYAEIVTSIESKSQPRL
jgi:hypothetical protein